MKAKQATATKTQEAYKGYLIKFPSSWAVAPNWVITKGGHFIGYAESLAKAKSEIDYLTA